MASIEERKQIVVFMIAVWRMSIMITREDGPGEIFKKLRYYLGAEDDFGLSEWEWMSAWGKLVSCPYCISVWVASIFVLIAAIFPAFAKALFIALAGSGVTVLIERLMEKFDETTDSV